MNWLAGLIRSLMLLIVLLCASNHSYAQQRFPKPEFKTEYTQPVPEHPAPRSPALEFLDLAILVLVMSLTAWVAIRRRSRYGILILTIFSLFYFGFYKQGCICSVGSIQNVALALADPTYRLPLVALLVFLLPLIFSLFFGRVFCAAACPLGAIQDLIIFKPINLPVWLRKSLYPTVDLSGISGSLCHNRHRFHHLPVRSVHRHLPVERQIHHDPPGHRVFAHGTLRRTPLLPVYLSLWCPPQSHLQVL